EGGAGRAPASVGRRRPRRAGLPAGTGDCTTPAEEVRRSRTAAAGSLCGPEAKRKHSARVQAPCDRGAATTRATLRRLGQEGSGRRVAQETRRAKAAVADSRTRNEQRPVSPRGPTRRGCAPITNEPIAPRRKGAHMATTVVSYTRGSTYIKEIRNGKTLYGLLGDMVVGGLAFDTIERFSLTGNPDF